jgi:hypothetical protein
MKDHFLPVQKTPRLTIEKENSEPKAFPLFGIYYIFCNAKHEFVQL